MVALFQSMETSKIEGSLWQLIAPDTLRRGRKSISLGATMAQMEAFFGAKTKSDAAPPQSALLSFEQGLIECFFHRQSQRLIAMRLCAPLPLRAAGWQVFKQQTQRVKAHLQQAGQHWQYVEAEGGKKCTAIVLGSAAYQEQQRLQRRLWLHDTPENRLAAALATPLETTHLNLNYGALNTLPTALAQCVHLRSLHLSGNAIDYLPPVFQQLQKLETLDISRNPLYEIPLWIKELPQLKELHIDFITPNDLQKSFELLQKMPALQYLSWRGLPYRFFPFFLMELPHLKKLDIGASPAEQYAEDLKCWLPQTEILV